MNQRSLVYVIFKEDNLFTALHKFLNYLQFTRSAAVLIVIREDQHIFAIQKIRKGTGGIV